MTADAWGFEPFDEDYDDVETALMAYLEGAGRTVTALMSWDKDGDLPAIRIKRIGGGSTPEGDDDPRVSIQCFARPTAENPRASQKVAADVERRMDALHGVVIGATCMDSATKDSGPVSRPWDDPTIRVTELIYRVPVRA